MSNLISNLLYLIIIFNIFFIIIIIFNIIIVIYNI